MRKLFLFIAAALVSTGMWAQDLNVSFTTNTAADWLKTYEGGITLSASSSSFSKGGDGYFNSSASSSTGSVDGNYFGISTTTAIQKVQLLIAPNSSTALNAILIGWDAAPTLTTCDTAKIISGTSTVNTLAGAEWLEWDLTNSTMDITYIRLYKSLSSNKFYYKDATKVQNPSNTQTCRVYGVKVWLKPNSSYSVTINPNGGAYASTPDGWTFNDGVYTKSVGAGSFNVPEGLTYSGYDLNGWKDGQGNDITLPITLSHDTTIIAQWAAHQTSSDATLADLKVDGVTVTGFAAATVEYNVELPFGTTVVPTVTATANSAYAKSVIVTQASSVSGVASVVVTAENNSTKTYTINFSVASSKELLLVFRTSIAACVGTPSVSDAILSNNAAVSTYINQITFDNVEGTGDDGKETGGNKGSLDVGKKAGNMFTLSVKKGYAFKEMSFKGKIQDANCEYSLDGGEWTTLTSTDTSNDDCYNPFSDAEVTQFRLRSTGNSGVWIRNMQLTIINSNKTPTSLDNTTSEINAIKRIENGQLIIEKNGKHYNAQGQVVR